MSVYNLADSEEELPSEIRQQLLNLYGLDSKVADLQIRLHATQKQRDIVYQQLERFCELRAPIRRVPYEVLAIIFSNHPEDQESRNSSLMRVCKAWRQIVMQTPRLWNHISLNLQKIEELPLLWRYARRCLIYSGRMPLYIRLDARNFDARHSFLEVAECLHEGGCPSYLYRTGSNAEENLIPFIDQSAEREEELTRIYECALLITLSIIRGEDDRFLKRWRSFHCYVCFPYDYNNVADTIAARIWDSMDGVTDNLVDLGLIPDYSDHEGWYPTGFKCLKSLKSLSISLDVTLDRLALPLATLERLIIMNSITSDHFLDFKSGAFPSLQLLQLEIEPADSESRHTIHLPALKVLALLGERYECILELLQAPCLTHLSIDCFSPAGHDLPSILNAVTDVMWTLRIEQDPLDLTRLLKATPSVRRIHMRRSSGANQDLVTLEMPSDLYYTDDAAEWPYIIPFGF